MNLTFSVDTARRAATVRPVGELDAATTDEFVDTATRLLDAHPGLRELHVDCTELGFCDSVGLSGLLLVERRTSGAGVVLHLDNRPAYFERILDITGILEYLTTRNPATASESSAEADEDATGSPH